MPSYSKSEIFRGPAKLELDSGSGFVDMGVVGDVRVTFEKTLQEESGEPWGSAAPHSYFNDGMRARVVVPVKQTVAENLAIAIDGDNQSNTVYIDDRPGRATERVLKLTAVQGKSGAGGIDVATDELMLYAVVSEGVGDVVFSRGEDRMYEVTFVTALDTTRAAGRRIGYWRRPAAS